MGKTRTRRRHDSKVAMDRKKAKAHREALWSYVLIAILIGIIFYGVYIQFLHHL